MQILGTVLGLNLRSTAWCLVFNMSLQNTSSFSLWQFVWLSNQTTICYDSALFRVIFWVRSYSRNCSITVIACVGRNSCKKPETLVTGQLLLDLFHSLYVDSAGLRMIDHGFGVVHSNYTLGDFLNTFWCIPRVKDEFGRKAPQYGQIASYKVSIRVCTSTKAHWTVTVKELLEERAARKPHPAACIHAPVCI